jgi:hypothetical protein
MGLLLRASADIAPAPGMPFLIVDDWRRIRAVSKEAERLLALTERELVDRNVNEVLALAAEEEARDLGFAVAEAGMTGVGVRAEGPQHLALRFRNRPGPPFLARIGACEPGPATVIALVDVT